VDDRHSRAFESARLAEESTAPVEDIGKASSQHDRVGVGSGDENVAKLQLATRWSEQYAPENDTLEEALRRFQRVYTYVDSVTKLVDPDQA
jgi:hypothetical protein